MMLHVNQSRKNAFAAKHFFIASVLISLAFLILVSRIFYLQINQGTHYQQKSESNFVQTRRIAHKRGLILDENNEVLMDSRLSHNLYMTLAFLPDSRRNLRKLGAVIGWEKAKIKELDRRVVYSKKQGETNQLFQPVEIIETEIAYDKCLKLENIIETNSLAGAELIYDPVRRHLGCDLQIDFDHFSSRKAVFTELKRLLEMDEDLFAEGFKKALGKARGLGKFKAVLLFADLPHGAYARLQSALALGRLPGIDIVDSNKRRAVGGPLASHVLGFINEMSGQQYRKLKSEGYYLGDKIGRRGIERSYEKLLRGKDGFQRVVVDSKGRSKGKIWAESLLGDESRIEPQNGHSLVLSIDADLQRSAEESFLGRAGSVVAIDVNTGFILAMASFPRFDANEVTGRDSRKVWRKLIKNPLKPLGNKSIQDRYSPGSTFKSITAVAGLREKIITPNTVRVCPGYFRLGRAKWRCYNRGGHGHIKLRDALQKSCDTYFYGVGYALGHDRLADTAFKLGFGKKPGLNIDPETPGIIPTSAYYKKRFKSVSPGLVVNSSIGQGDVTVTPLQLGMSYAAIIGGGIAFKPQIIHEIRQPNGEVVESFAPIQSEDLGLEPETLDVVRESLSHVTERGGTAAGLMWRRDMPKLAHWMRNSGIRIGGKTGTAQVVRLSKSVAHIDPKDVPYKYRDHAWFVGFAPVDAPEIVVVTMTEHGGFGGSMSAPVSASVIKTWFEKVRLKKRFVKDREDRAQRKLEQERKKSEDLAKELKAAQTSQPNLKGQSNE